MVTGVVMVVVVVGNSDVHAACIPHIIAAATLLSAERILSGEAAGKPTHVDKAAAEAASRSARQSPGVCVWCGSRQECV